MSKAKLVDSYSEGPTVVALLSAAGELSSGFKAGHKVVGGLECWKPACDSFQLNEPDAVVWCEDVRKVDAEEFAARYPFPVLMHCSVGHRARVSALQMG